MAYKKTWAGEDDLPTESSSFFRDWGSNPFNMGDLGSIANMMGDFASAMNQNKSLRFQAHQVEQQADTERAIGTRQMQEMRRKKRAVISDMTASMAGGMGAAMDANMVKLQAKTASRIDTNMLMQKWMSDTKATSLDLKAKMLRRDAKIAKGIGLGKVLTSVGKMFGG